MVIFVVILGFRSDPDSLPLEVPKSFDVPLFLSQHVTTPIDVVLTALSHVGPISPVVKRSFHS